MITNY